MDLLMTLFLCTTKTHSDSITIIHFMLNHKLLMHNRVSHSMLKLTSHPLHVRICDLLHIMSEKFFVLHLHLLITFYTKLIHVDKNL